MTTSPTILITGATNGPGRALAHHYAAADAALILHGRDPASSSAPPMTSATPTTRPDPAPSWPTWPT